MNYYMKKRKRNETQICSDNNIMHVNIIYQVNQQRSEGMGIPAIEITKDGTTDISSYLSDENEYPDSGRRRSSSVHQQQIQQQQQQQQHQHQQHQQQQQHIQQSQHVQNQNSPIHQHQVREVCCRVHLNFFFCTFSFLTNYKIYIVVLQPDVIFKH